MLAYELFLQNKEHKGEFLKNSVPIKKVFCEALPEIKVKIDDRTLDEYGDVTDSKTKAFQNWLSMPLNDQEALRLPYRGTGARSLKPYIEIYGAFKAGRVKLSIGKAKKLYSFEFDVGKENSATPIFDGDVSLTLDKSKYRIGSKILSEAYKDAGLISSSGVFPKEVFEKVCNAFAVYVSTRSVEIPDSKRGVNFRLVVLPEDKGIIYAGSESAPKPQANSIDSFGQGMGAFAKGTTRTAKFLSFDDPAFALNCAQGQKFYENLGIGEQSLERIEISSRRVFRISGLEWIFSDISNPHSEFLQTNKGIFLQLFENHEELKRRAGRKYVEQSMMKAVCFRRQQAKLEILMDENLTLGELGKALKTDAGVGGSKFAFEALIEKATNGKMYWDKYLVAVRSLLKNTPLNKWSLLHDLSLRVRKELFSWLKKPSDARQFFERTYFCIGMLTEEGKSNGGVYGMNPSEDFAYKTGLIAGRYVRFKKEAGEGSGSTSDILTYSAYDRERLRFVLKRVGLGTELSKAENKEEIERYVRANLSKGEIPDSEANADYSYFFYKGVFEQLNGG